MSTVTNPSFDLLIVRESILVEPVDVVALAMEIAPPAEVAANAVVVVRLKL